MTRERTSRHGREDGRHVAPRATVSHGNRVSRQLSYSNRTSNYVAAPASTTQTLPSYRTLGLDYAQHQSSDAHNPLTLPNTLNGYGAGVPYRSNGYSLATGAVNAYASATASEPQTSAGEGELEESNSQALASANPVQSSQCNNQTDSLRAAPDVAESDELSTQSNQAVEIDVNSRNEINLSSQNSAVPIVSPISGYSITALPRPPLDPTTAHQQILMVDNSVVSGYNSNGPSCAVAEPRYPIPSQCQPLSVLPTCVPQEFLQPRPRRDRRHRQRRRRRRRRRSRHHSRRRPGASGEGDGYVKPRCCSVLGCKICLAGCLQFKKVLLFFASLGVVCVLIGIVLGVLRAPGNSFFMLSLMFVGKCEFSW